MSTFLRKTHDSAEWQGEKNLTAPTSVAILIPYQCGKLQNVSIRPGRRFHQKIQPFDSYNFLLRNQYPKVFYKREDKKGGDVWYNGIIDIEY